jgi:hypothetical protein
MEVLGPVLRALAGDYPRDRARQRAGVLSVLEHDLVHDGAA